MYYLYILFDHFFILFHIDFILEHNGHVYPIEVKVEENLQSKSLKVFFEKYKPNYTIRFSMLCYRNQGWLQNIPLFGVGQLLVVIDGE
jgi:uncharacterized protein